MDHRPFRFGTLEREIVQRWLICVALCCWTQSRRLFEAIRMTSERDGNRHMTLTAIATAAATAQFV